MAIVLLDIPSSQGGTMTGSIVDFPLDPVIHKIALYSLQGTVWTPPFTVNTSRIWQNGAVQKGSRFGVAVYDATILTKGAPASFPPIGNGVLSTALYDPNRLQWTGTTPSKGATSANGTVNNLSSLAGNLVYMFQWLAGTGWVQAGTPVTLDNTGKWTFSGLNAQAYQFAVQLWSASSVVPTPPSGCLPQGSMDTLYSYSFGLLITSVPPATGGGTIAGGISGIDIPAFNPYLVVIAYALDSKRNVIGSRWDKLQPNGLWSFSNFPAGQSYAVVILCDVYSGMPFESDLESVPDFSGNVIAYSTAAPQLKSSKK